MLALDIAVGPAGLHMTVAAVDMASWAVLHSIVASVATLHSLTLD